MPKIIVKLPPASAYVISQEQTGASTEEEVLETEAVEQVSQRSRDLNFMILIDPTDSFSLLFNQHMTGSPTTPQVPAAVSDTPAEINQSQEYVFSNISITSLAMH